MRPELASPAPRPVATDGQPSFSAALATQDVPLAALDAVVERTPTPVLLADRDGHVAYANTAARRLDAERLEALRWAVTRALLTEDAAHEGPLAARGPDGASRWLELHVVPVRDTDGRIAGVVATIGDVTARRRLEQWEPVMESLMNL